MTIPFDQELTPELISSQLRGIVRSVPDSNEIDIDLHEDDNDDDIEENDSNEINIDDIDDDNNQDDDENSQQSNPVVTKKAKVGGG